MSRITILAAFFVIAIQALHAGSVNLLPMQPTAGGEVTIEYKPSDGEQAWVERVGTLSAVAFTFTEEADAPRAYDVPLKFDGKRHVGTFTIPDGVVFALVKVGDGLQYDTNKDRYWDFLVHDASGKPLRNAHLRRALSWLGGMPSECRRKEDQNEALSETSMEVMKWPSNLTARVNEVLLMANLQQISQEEMQARLREVVNAGTQPQDPMAAIAVAQAYRSLQQPEEASKVMQTASQRFPGSKVAEQLELEALSSAPNLDGFVAKVIEHLKKYPQTFARQNLIDYVIDATANARELKVMVRFVENVPGLPAVTYYQVVNYIGAADTMRVVAMKLVDEGIAAADDAKRRPPYTSPIEWQHQQRISKSLLYFVKGAVLKAQGDPDGALAAFDQSLKIGGDQTEQNAYAMYIETLRIKSKDDKALDVARMAIKNGASNQSIIDNYRQLQKAAGRSDAQVNAELAELEKQGSALLVERLSREMLNLNMIDGQFTSLDGKPVNISDWKGKVVILDYWATWCGPCVKSFPSMQKLYEKYKNHPNVQFAIVNVWERADDRNKQVTEFLGKNKDLTFPVFFDLSDAVVQKYGVTGIPTKFYLGKDGRIQFKEVGYLPEEQFIKDATEKIQVLLAQ